MYPTANPLANDPSRIRKDIEYLTKTVNDASHKVYLTGPLIDSLVALGHTRDLAEEEVKRYFKHSVQ